VIDLGTQHNKTYDKDQHKVCLIWELPDVDPIEVEGKMLPKVTSRIYTNSLGSKAILRQHLESWRGKAFTQEELEGFDLGKLVGANCQLQIIHETKGEDTYANISTIVNVPKGHKAVQAVNPTVIYDIGDPVPDDTVPDWICKLIREAKEWEQGDVASDAMAQDEADGQHPEQVPEEQTDVEPF
jgi:hypothetical protein